MAAQDSLEDDSGDLGQAEEEFMDYSEEAMLSGRVPLADEDPSSPSDPETQPDALSSGTAKKLTKR